MGISLPRKIPYRQTGTSSLQLLITAYEVRRNVNLYYIFYYHLWSAPAVVTKMNETHGSASKAILSQLLTADVTCSPGLHTDKLGDAAALINDGLTIVIAFGTLKGLSPSV